MGRIKGKLTSLERRFVEEYLVDLNASAACLRAGYKTHHPDALSGRIMSRPHIQAAISAAMAERGKRTEITADRVIKELAKVGFGDLRAVMKWGPNGVELKDSQGLSDDAAAIVQEVSETQGERTTTRRLKTNDKVKALELLGRHLGMFKDQVGGDDVPMPVKVEICVVDGRKE